jgi:N-acetylglucosaminyldiphosphoundecaprenol N-acetyl-beta-D-mannosaminyltransferase
LPAAFPDDLARDVYCVLGVPVDTIEMPDVVWRIRAAVANATPFLTSTVNLNFVATSIADPEFRDSVILSDLCPVDGMPIVWIARLLGIPIKHRVAGSDIFKVLKTAPRDQPLRLFMFGGAEGVAAAAANTVNAKPGGLRCVGSMYPGFGSVDDMSDDVIIDAINASNADLLVVGLGAAKGQVWLLRNRHRLKTPVRTHLGAVLNFEAGAVKRAPERLARLGLEWLWRIKEEPHLWRRYGHDLGVLARLFVTRVLPLAIEAGWQRWAGERQRLCIAVIPNEAAVTLRLSGDASARHVTHAISCFRNALESNRPLVIDLSSTRRIDARFFGLVLVLRKQLKSRGMDLKFIGISPRLARLFRLNGVAFLLSE